MSMDPAMMQQMLTQRLQQGPSAATAGGGAAGPQMASQTSPVNAAATMAQKALLINALRNQQAGNANPVQTMQANAGMPGAQATMANNPTMQGLQGSPASVLSPDQLQQLQMPVNPAMAIPDGVS